VIKQTDLRHSIPVTPAVRLISAPDREDAAARPAMLAQHLACLTALTAAVSAVTADPGGELGAPEVGLPC
jgi:hypothetical protein